MVTGLGIVSPIGIGWQQAWPAALAGTSGAGAIDHFDTTDFSCRIGCQVTGFDPLQFIERRALRRMSRASQLAVAASLLAREDAGLSISDGRRAGVVISSSSTAGDVFEENEDALLEGRRVSPVAIPMTIMNMATGHAAIALGLSGPASCIATACASGNHGIGEAWWMVRSGAADLAFAGGAEACLYPYGIASLDATRAMSRRNDDPARASRPFDADRDGFVAAEGSGVLVLESLEHARRRGATVICELGGYGASNDAYHLTDPDPSGRWQEDAMRTALGHAGIEPAAVDYVNAHGTSTPAGDPVEISAIRRLTGERATEVLVSSTKSMTGHALAAAGGLEAVLTALALRDQVAPPTINLDHLDPACAGVAHVADAGRAAPIGAALSNSFGFGGHNAVLAFTRMEGR